MTYEVSVLCDVRAGNRVEKRLCHSDRHSKIKVPSFDGMTPRLAIYGINQIARNAGWVRFFRPGAGLMWICPVCKEVSTIAGLQPQILRENNICKERNTHDD